MSAAGSPTADGSPAASAGQGLTGLDGAEIARRMVQAAEAAASAAHRVVMRYQESLGTSHDGVACTQGAQFSRRLVR